MTPGTGVVAAQALTLNGAESYLSVHRDGWVEVWRIPDGVPLAAATAVLLERPKPSASGGSGGGSAS